MARPICELAGLFLRCTAYCKPYTHFPIYSLSRSSIDWLTLYLPYTHTHASQSHQQIEEPSAIDNSIDRKVR